MIYTALKKTVAYHLTAGMILSIVIASVIMIGKYEKSLSETISRIAAIKANAARLDEYIRQMDSAIKRIDNILPPDYNSKTHRDLMLLALDGIKSTFKGSEITVSNFEEKSGEMSLPVAIKFPVENYAEMVNRIGYLQSLRLPDFTIRKAVIEKTSDRTYSGIICSIEGLLHMPAEHLKGKKG